MGLKLARSWRRGQVTRPAESFELRATSRRPTSFTSSRHASTDWLHTLDQASQHPLNLINLTLQHSEGSCRQQFQIPGQKQMVFQFHRGTACDVRKTRHLTVRPSAGTFCDVGSHGRCCRANLRGQTIEFLFRKLPSEPIHLKRCLVRLAPHFEFFKILQRRLSFSPHLHGLVIARGSKLEARGSEAP